MVKVRENLTGKQFGYLTVLHQTEDRIDNKGRHFPMWVCRCKCGNICVIDGNRIKGLYTKSCGCYATELKYKKNKYDLSGEYGIGYTSKGEEFYFDLEDYDKIKDYCWNTTRNGYIATNIYTNGTKRTLFMHNIIMDNFNNEKVPDHIHGKNTRNDNRKSNLRLATYSQNKMNTEKLSNNTSGVTGVDWNKSTQKWRARIKINQKEIYLGLFDNVNEAIQARKEAEEKYFGEWSYDNSQKTQLN